MSRRGYRKPGLWFTATKAEVEHVNPMMKKLCMTCGELPEGKRLKITKGSGRHQTTMVFCQTCGEAWIDEFKALAQRAKAYLTRGLHKAIGSIRKV